MSINGGERGRRFLIIFAVIGFAVTGKISSKVYVIACSLDDYVEVLLVREESLWT